MINNDFFGANINCSFVYNNGQFEMGVHYKDSNDNDFSVDGIASNLEDAANICFSKISEKLSSNTTLNETINKIKNQINDSEEQIMQLEQQINELKNKNEIRKREIEKIKRDTFLH